LLPGEKIFTEFEPATGDNVKENNNISKADSATKQVIRFNL
jgi:ribosomal protein L28